MADESRTPPDDGKPVIRIDAAHKSLADKQLDAVDAEVAVAASVIAEGANEQILVQAQQLAHHLQQRRREVDHREAHLNARIAQLENDLRISRMWMRERSEEFQRREAELSKQISEQESQIRGLTMSESALDETRLQHARELENREAELNRREQALALGQQRLLEEIEALRQAQDEIESERPTLETTVHLARQERAALAERERQVRERERRLDEQEQSLDSQVRQLYEEREQFDQQRQSADELLEEERRKLAEKQQQFEEARERYQKNWEARQQQLDEQQVILERIRGDVLRLHREALEMRLIGEQLWAQVSGRLSGTDLTHRLATLKSQLADEFRLAHQDLANQRTGLEQLVQKLDEKRRELTDQRDELMAWFTRRQSELAKQASQLESRDRLLQKERREHQELAEKWESEKRELQREIRKLTLQLRQNRLVAA